MRSPRFTSLVLIDRTYSSTLFDSRCKCKPSNPDNAVEREIFLSQTMTVTVFSPANRVPSQRWRSCGAPPSHRETTRRARSGLKVSSSLRDAGQGTSMTLAVTWIAQSDIAYRSSVTEPRQTQSLAIRGNDAHDVHRPRNSPSVPFVPLDASICKSRCIQRGLLSVRRPAL